MVSNFNYLFYDFALTSNDGSNTDSLISAYFPSHLDYFDFNADDSYIEAESSDNLTGLQIGFEIDEAFEFSNVLLDSQTGDGYAYFYSNSLNDSLEVTMGNFEISAMGTSALSGTTSVPEPSTWMLFGTVLMGLGVSKRLKLKRNK